jgi:signal transduction histidine kinase
MILENLPLTFDCRAITKEGKVKYLSLRVLAIEYKGKPAMQLIIEDVTEQKNTEKKLQSREEELRRAYKHLRRTESELRKKAEELSGVNKMRSEFLDLIAHELKSSLTPIEVYIDAIRRGELGDVTLVQKKKFDEIIEKIKKIDRMVEDIFDLSKIEIGMIKISKEPVYLPDIVSGVVEDLKPQIESKNHRVTLNISEEFPITECDPRLLDKVFRNLISNAILYTPDGGEITIDLSKNEDIHIRVSDTGIGIPEEDKEKIFQKFYRVKREKEKVRGLGIGLALAKHFVELHRGRIWVESSLGKGSTFHVKLPGS